MVKDKEIGFTLIEVVIAISLLSVILVTLYSSLDKIIETKNILDDRRDTTTIASAVLGRITRELQLSYAQSVLMPPMNDQNKKYPPRVSLVGEPRVMEQGRKGAIITFLALEGGQYLPDGGTHSGLVQITYRTEPNPEDKSGETSYLVREEIPYTRPFEKAYKKAMIFPISHSVVSLDLKYHGEQSEEWSATWGDEKRLGLPNMVKLSLTVRSPLGKNESYLTTVALRAK